MKPTHFVTKSRNMRHALATLTVAIWIVACVIAYCYGGFTLKEVLGFSVPIVYGASIILEYIYDSTMWIGGVPSPSLRQDNSIKNGRERLMGLALGGVVYSGALIMMLTGFGSEYTEFANRRGIF